MNRIFVVKATLGLLMMAGQFTASSTSQGQTLSWTRQQGTSSIDLCNDTVVDSNGNVIIVGRTDGQMAGASFGGADIFIRKYDPSGAIMWTRQFGTSSYDEALAVTVNADNLVFVTGRTNGSLFAANAGNEDVFVIRLRDTDGATQVTGQFGTTEDDRGEGIAVASDSRIYVAGSTTGKLDGNTDGGWDCFVGRFTNAMNLLQIDQFGSSADDFCNDLTLDVDGNAILTGKTLGNLYANNQGLADMFAAAYKVTDSSSNQIWGRQLGTSSQDEARAVDAWGDSILVVGWTDGSFAGSQIGFRDGFAMQFKREDGGVIDQVQFGTPDDDMAHDVTSGPDGQAYISGGTKGDLAAFNAGDNDIFVFRSSHQNIQSVEWMQQYGTSQSDVAFGVGVASPGSVYVAGSTDGNLNGADGFFDPFVTKLLEPYRIQPGDFNTFRGILVSGDLSDVFDSDNSYLEFNPGLTLNSNENPVWILFGTQLPTTPSSLNVYLEARADTPGLQQTLEIYNWVSAEYDVVDVRAASFNNDQTVVESFTTSDISKVVSPDDDSISIRVGWRAVGPTLVFPWQISIDYVSSEIEN